MRRIRRTEVTVETDEITIIRRLPHTALTKCPYCGEAIVTIVAEPPAGRSVNAQPRNTPNDEQAPAIVLIGENGRELKDPGQT